MNNNKTIQETLKKDKESEKINLSFAQMEANVIAAEKQDTCCLTVNSRINQKWNGL